MSASSRLEAGRTAMLCLSAFGAAAMLQSAFASTDLAVSVETETIEFGPSLFDTSEEETAEAGNGVEESTVLEHEDVVISDLDEDNALRTEGLAFSEPQQAQQGLAFLATHPAAHVQTRRSKDSGSSKTASSTGAKLNGNKETALKISIENPLAEPELVFDVPHEVLQRSKRLFRGGFGSPTFLRDPRFSGSVFGDENAGATMVAGGRFRNSNGLGSETEGDLADSELELGFKTQGSALNESGLPMGGLDPKKSYTVVNGQVLEVKPVSDKERLATAVPQITQNDSALIVSTSVSSKTSPIPYSTTAPSAEQGVAKGTAPAVSSQLETEKRELVLPPAQVALSESSLLPANGQGIFDHSFNVGRSGSVKGYVLVPAGVDPKTVVIQLAGTQLQVQPDAQGYFELNGLPKGSKFELVLWDTNSVLGRRVVPASADGSSDLEVPMSRSSDLVSLAAAFGEFQDITNYGFCGTAKARSSEALVGAQVLNRAGLKPKYFSDEGLPLAQQVQMGASGEFCFLNVQQRVFDFEIRLANGAKRTFTIHAVPGFFDRFVSLDVESAVYRPARAFELVESLKSFEATQEKQSLKFGLMENRDWTSTGGGSVWSPVDGLFLNTDFSYGFVDTDRQADSQIEQEAQEDLVSTRQSELVYLPVGQELQSIRYRSDDEVGLSVEPSLNDHSFVLKSKSEIHTDKTRLKLSKSNASGEKRSVVTVDRSQEFHLFVEPYGVLDDALSGSRFQKVDKTLGTAFVSLNLASLGLNSAEVRISAKDVATGKSVGVFEMFPSAPEAADEAGMSSSEASAASSQPKNPKHLRGLLSQLPTGQFSLVVTNAQGAVKWLDVVRSTPGSFQVITVKE